MSTNLHFLGVDLGITHDELYNTFSTEVIEKLLERLEEVRREDVASATTTSLIMLKEVSEKAFSMYKDMCRMVHSLVGETKDLFGLHGKYDLENHLVDDIDAKFDGKPEAELVRAIAQLYRFMEDL